ncbi:UNVERIFIED_CONTAM: hypothetical protein K2H54_033880 [Gekko kuhli]
MAALLETTLGDLVVDLYTEERPRACLNFLKLCKIKYQDKPYSDLSPFDDPPGLAILDRSPEPTKEQLDSGRIGADEEIDDFKGRSVDEVEEILAEKEAKTQAILLEMVGNLPDADIKPPENVLFVCKLNPVTTDEDLEIIFSRFGPIKSCEVIRDWKTGESLCYAFIEFEKEEDCEKAYFKMNNVLIDDRQIHVDFSQSVAKIKWKGRGGKYTKEDFKDYEKDDDKTSKLSLKEKAMPKQDTRYDLVLVDEEEGAKTSHRHSEKKKKKKYYHSDDDENEKRSKHPKDPERRHKDDSSRERKKSDKRECHRSRSRSHSQDTDDHYRKYKDKHHEEPWEREHEDKSVTARALSISAAQDQWQAAAPYTWRQEPRGRRCRAEDDLRLKAEGDATATLAHAYSSGTAGHPKHSHLPRAARALRHSPAASPWERQPCLPCRPPTPGETLASAAVGGAQSPGRPITTGTSRMT